MVSYFVGETYNIITMPVFLSWLFWFVSNWHNCHIQSVVEFFLQSDRYVLQVLSVLEVCMCVDDRNVSWLSPKFGPLIVWSPQKALVSCCWVTEHLLLLSVWWSWEEKGQCKELVGKIHHYYQQMNLWWSVQFVLVFPFSQFASVIRVVGDPESMPKLLVKLLGSWMRTYWSGPIKSEAG